MNQYGVGTHVTMLSAARTDFWRAFPTQFVFEEGTLYWSTTNVFDRSGRASGEGFIFSTSTVQARLTSLS